MPVQGAEQMVPSAEHVEWPDMNELRRSQKINADEDKNGLTLEVRDKLLKKERRIWIPSKDKELQLKVMVISLCGPMGHRGADATKSVLKEPFYWEHLDKDVELFVSQCFHCILTRSGDLIPRPFATALHGERPNEVLHVNFVYMGPGMDSKK